MRRLKIAACLISLPLWLRNVPAQGPVDAALTEVVPIVDARVVTVGRVDVQHNQAVRLGFPGSGFIVRFHGKSLKLQLTSDSDSSALTALVDHGEPRLILVPKGQTTVAVAGGLDDQPHIVEVYKRTETWQGLLTLHGLSLDFGEDLLSPPLLPARKLLFLGDSVTCGAGIGNNDRCQADPLRPANDAYHSFGMDLGRRLDAQVQLVCYGGRGLVRDYRGLGIAENVLNAPQFLDLAIATDDPKERSDWNPAKWTPDGIVIALGTNDFNLQEKAPLNARDFVAHYVALLRKLNTEYPGAKIFATEGSIVTNLLLRQYIQQAVDEVHDADVTWVKATHYPGNGCDPHPTQAQQSRIADDLEPVLRHELHW